MIVIVKMKFGSHLYGTNTSTSDIDYKGVFLPSKKEILLGRIPKSINLSTNKSNEKNSPDDIDTELYALHYFIQLACAGETVALDMLHAPIPILEGNVNSIIWEEIIRNRHRFYTKNLRAFVGYARRQVAKYGIKGSRLNAAKGFLNFLDGMNATRLSDIWDYLIEDEHRHFIETNPNGIRQYQVCGKILQETMHKDYAYDIIQRFYDAYGHRAEMAAENKGIDWKAVSHAIRAACQVKELLTKKTITFPRPEAKLLLDVKQGKLDYQTKVGPVLDDLMGEVERLSSESTLPEKPDRKFWDRFIIQTIEDYVL